MWFFIGFAVALVLLSLYLWKFQTALFSKVILALLSGVLFVGELAEAAGAFDWNSVLPAPWGARAVALTVIIAFIARFTKSKLAGQTEPQA